MRAAHGPGRGGRRGRGRRAGIWLAALAVALFAVFVVLAVLSGPESALSAADRRVTAAFAAWRTVGRTHLFWAATLVGNDELLATLSFSAVLLLAVWGQRARAALFAVGMLVGWGISEAAKAIVGRVRPPAAEALIALPHSHSLPSGHAFSTLVFLGLLVFLAWRVRDGLTARGAAPTGWVAPGPALTATAAGVAVAALIGVSRIYIGVHWLTDVVGGWCLGGAWLVVLIGFVVPAWRRWTGGTEAPGRSLRGFLARRPPARMAVRVGTVVFVVVLCVGVAVATGISDPLLREV